MFKFKVIDNNTNQEADVYELIKERWAQAICSQDVDGFRLTEDGELELCDFYGASVLVPRGRFTIKMMEVDEKMVAEYTERVHGFQIRDVVRFGGATEKEEIPTTYDIVKWKTCKPYKAYSVEQQKVIEATEHCYSIGFLVWDEKEQCLNLRSVGLRFLEDYPDKEVVEMIYDFAMQQTKKLRRKQARKLARQGDSV